MQKFPKDDFFKLASLIIFKILFYSFKDKSKKLSAKLFRINDVANVYEIYSFALR